MQAQIHPDTYIWRTFVSNTLIIEFWGFGVGEGHLLFSQLLCASENLRFSDVSAVLGQESFQVDFLPITIQNGLER